RLDELDESSVGDPVVVDLDLGATIAVAGDGAEDAGLRAQDLLHARLVLGAVHPAHEKEHGGHDSARLSDVDHDPVDLRSPARNQPIQESRSPLQSTPQLRGLPRLALEQQPEYSRGA